MPAYLPSALLLSFCWIASLAILLLFLESPFASTSREKFVARRASGAYGICSVFVVLRGSTAAIEKTIHSIFSQTYPFLELFLIFPEDDPLTTALAQEFRASRTHTAVRLVPVPHPVESAAERIRALELARPSAKGRWFAVIEAGLSLDQFAIEASMEFAGSGEVSALALRPGTQASSFVHGVLAPSLENLFHMMRVVERRRAPRSRQMILEAPYLLVNRDAFEVVHRINQMPGILNEAGWTMWSHQLEGLRTFDGDGSRWLWRETALGTWPDYTDLDRRFARRSGSLLLAATLAALIPIAGLVYASVVPITSWLEEFILAVSAVSYALMTISYFLYARRLHAAAWFAPFWFVAQPIAAVLTFRGIRNATEGAAFGSATRLGGGPLPGGKPSRHDGRTTSRRP
jgi:hypothetical protein